jgi:hypothetical protein
MNGSIAHSATTTTTAAAAATNDQSATAAVTNHDATTTKESFTGEEQRELKQELPTVTSTTTAAATQTSTAGAGTIATGTTASKIPSCIQDGWFSEVEPTWPGQKLSLALEVRCSKCLILFVCIFSFWFDCVDAYYVSCLSH